MNTSDMKLTAGLGLKPEHYEEALACQDTGLWWEVHPENYLADGGPRLAWLDAIRSRHPVSLHGVSLSLAADAPPDETHLARLAALVRRVEPALVSEHLAWSHWRGVYQPDLLPFPRTQQALARVARNIERTQEALGRPIAIENPSHYLHLPGHDMGEGAFFAELVRRTGCQLLLDINNVFVSANNLGTDPLDYLDQYPLHAVAEMHLAGHHADPVHGAALLIDSHDAPVAEPVWALWQHAIARTGPVPTLIERDAELPPLAELLAERARAHRALCAAPHEELACN
jgi:uncharacterized protein (UPF0276 family)